MLALVAALGAPALAQDYGQWDDDGSAITASGNGKTFDGNCTGKDVHLMGNDQTVKLHGVCGDVTSMGDNKHDARWREVAQDHR